MPPKVTYWTGTWDPAKEAISKEIDSLRVGDRASSSVVSFSPGQTTRFVRSQHALLLSAKAWPILRLTALLIERRGDLSHVFGGPSSWHLLRALGRRPILLTAVVGSDEPGTLPLENVARVVVEAEGAEDEWVRRGVPRDRIEVIHPGIDVDWFAQTPAPTAKRFTLLFASTPADPAEIPGRGIPLLVELARTRTDIDIVLPWRKWGDVGASQRALDALKPTPNFVVEYGDCPDMRRFYSAAHATIACFARGVGKTVPNFVVEGLASGRPCIATSGIGLAGDLRKTGAGIVCSSNVAELSRAIDAIRDGWSDFSARARALAQSQFSLMTFRRKYERLYAQVTAGEVARLD